jgi:hypothetical protein
MPETGLGETPSRILSFLEKLRQILRCVTLRAWKNKLLKKRASDLSSARHSLIFASNQGT